MKLFELLGYEECDCETVYLDEEGNEILDEGFIRQMKKVGTKMKKQYRCTSGPKQGRIVADPKQCMKRKDPKKRRQGRMSARKNKAVRKMKTKVAKKRSISKMITRINKRLSGK